MLKMYDFAAIERKWQTRWERERLYRAADSSEKPKYYSMEMLPYPSGNLHVGHANNYAFGDAVAGFDESTRERFFWRNGAELLGLA